MTPIREFCDRYKLPVRVYNLLQNERIEFAEQAANISDAEFLNNPNFGRKSLRELRAALAAHRITNDW